MSDRNAAIRALKLLDLTELGDGCREDHVEALIQKAQTPHGPVAAVCIWPQFVSLARRRLEGTAIRIATVINFPKGGDDVERAIDDTAEALKDGADEIDLVMPWRALLADDEATVRSMIGEVHDEIDGQARLKVILETGMLPDRPRCAALPTSPSIAAPTSSRPPRARPSAPPRRMRCAPCSRRSRRRTARSA